jgi:glycosyltransferase involved in cell wall biosynthesis
VTRLDLRPYAADDIPAPRSVPLSVLVLTRDEEPNIGRCLTSVAWAEQVVVIDSGSTDGTVAAAKSLGAEVVEQVWLGFSEQREAALHLPSLRHDWVYFVDADEWVSPRLAAEIASVLRNPNCAAFAHRLRLVFQGTWIRHCGWYRGSWVVRLVDRRYAKYDGSALGERACIDGQIRRLHNDIVDDDLKGLATWLHKHVRYAQLEARLRDSPNSRPVLGRASQAHQNSRPLLRALLKDVIFPVVPAKPVALFIYMYLVRLGILDGRAGLRFCFYHAWYEVSVGALRSRPTVLKRKDH